MLVVLDATAYCADFQMSGNAWRIFLAGHRRAGLEPCLPASVRDEVVNKYREELEAVAQKADKLVREASRVTSRHVPHAFPSATTIEPSRSEYFDRLLTLTVERGFRNLPYPKVPHEVLVARALARRRPFRDNGSGYRDALLWSAVLECLEQAREPLAFVTANTNDFGAEELHSDLRRDVAELKLAPADVRLFQSLEALNHALIVPTLKRLDNLRASLESGSGPVSLEAWITKELPTLMGDEEGLGPLAPGHGRTTFASVKAVRSLRVDAVRQVAPDQVLVSVTARLEGMLDITADWDDYQQYEDVREFFASDDHEPFSWVSADYPITLTVAFTLIVAPDGQRVLSSEIDWYDTEFVERVELNPHTEDVEAG